MGAEVGNEYEAEKGKGTQRCVVELLTNMSNWDSTLSGNVQNTLQNYWPETKKRETYYYLLLTHIYRKLSRVYECTGLAEQQLNKNQQVPKQKTQFEVQLR